MVLEFLDDPTVALSQEPVLNPGLKLLAQAERLCFSMMIKEVTNSRLDLLLFETISKMMPHSIFL